ncbi:MAG: TrkA family potassium uptake protein [Armatimonadetes bacterium]|nr:TrkA family potassium uptake protein [Chloroflexota bacterium]MCH7945644.1 TrkA family potassium uptake protein [Armatimonadota bacterium]
MYIIIVGGGKVGYYLAKELVEADHEVLILEQNPSKCAEISETLGEIVMRGDGCEAAIQEKVGTGRAALFLAVTGDDADNLVACQVAQHMFKVPRTVARINNPKNELIFRKLGIDHTVSATSAIMAHIEQELPSHPLIPLLHLRHGFEIVEVKVPDTAAVVGTAIKDVQLPNQSLIWGIVDADGSPKETTAETVLHAGDEVVAVTLQESEEALRSALTSSLPQRSF